MRASPIPEPTDHVGPPDARETVEFVPIRIVTYLDGIGSGKSGKSPAHSPLTIQGCRNPDNTKLSRGIKLYRPLPRHTKGSVRRPCGGGKVTAIGLDVEEI